MYHSLFFWVTIWLKICIPKSTKFHLPNKWYYSTKCNMKYRSVFLGHHQFHPFEVTKHVCRSHNIYLPSTISITCPTFYIHCPLFCPTFNVYLPSTISITCPTVYIHLYLMLPSPFTRANTWLLIIPFIKELFLPYHKQGGILQWHIF